MSSFTKREQIVILFIVFIIILSLSFKFLLKDLFITNESEIGQVSQVDQGVNLGMNEEDVLVVDEEDSLIMVHISGQVYNSGIIKLVKGDRVIDAVNLAGGLTKDADLDKINLAKRVIDEEKIYIPKIGEVITNEVSQNSQIPQVSTDNSSNSNKVNINTCSSEQLQGLPGIGEVIAGRIMGYRSSTPFKNVDELKNVSGIGEKKFEDIKNLVTVQ